jgi:hypothetical protein
MSVTIPDKIHMTRHEVTALIDIEPVLKRLGLSLYCLRCHARGEKDGVRAMNHPDDPELVVECGCTVRAYEQRAGGVS